MVSFHWSNLYLYDGRGGSSPEAVTPATEPEAARALAELRRTGGMAGWFGPFESREEA